MSLMSCCMLRSSANTVRLAVEERLQKRIHACKVFVVGSQRRRALSRMGTLWICHGWMSQVSGST
uniref:Uncharacterized protein n=1 Tax=Oryza punctata TaxID=4537 RepID=A0A0E0KUZ1_ORYPU